MLSGRSGWSRERTPSFSSAKVPSGKASQSTWNLKNCERCFPNSITAFVSWFFWTATGLRRSELLALKWEDIDFERLQINVRRSIYLNVVGNCKTEASRKPVPLDLTLASDLWAWKQDSAYRQPHDWIFASPHSRGRNPYWPDILLARVVRPAAVRAGIQKHIGWHTFRHSFSTMLMANGENVK